MKIKRYDDDQITFSDGSSLTYCHNQDCCERNWADFSVLGVFYDGEEFDDYEVIPADGCGFLLRLLGCKNFAERKNILIPCYSDQNGYYSTELTIIRRNKEGDEVSAVRLDCEERI